MKESKKAAFSLISYKIPSFKFTDFKAGQELLSIKFEPSGKYWEKDSLFILTFDFIAFYGSESTELISAKMEASFKFDDTVAFEQLPVYFYRNSIAIIFPYLRAFVSTLTSVANSQALILPVLNLSELEEPLKRNSIKVAEEIAS